MRDAVQLGRDEHVIEPGLYVAGLGRLGHRRFPGHQEARAHRDAGRPASERGGQAPAYADFIEARVRPMIEARYGKPQRVGVIGSSLGGLMSLYQAQRYPGHYDFVASLSGTLGWGSGARPKQTILDAYRAVPPRDLVVYVDSGGGPDGGDNYASNRRFADAMAAHGYRWNENLFHLRFDEELRCGQEIESENAR